MMRVLVVHIVLTTLMIICYASPLANGAKAEETLPKMAAISAAMQKCVADQEAMFIVTLVASHDQILHFDATGKSEAGSPDGRDNLFWIASMTKPITAAATMMLVDDGKLSLDDPISKYIPEFADVHTPDGEKRIVTLRQCLTHTSGMADLTPDQLRGITTLKQATEAFAKVPLLKIPGEEWRYCQSGINTAGRVVEVASGMPFEQFLAERIFKPLQMKDTAFYLTEEQAKRVAPSYEQTKEGTLSKTKIRLLLGDQSATDRNRMPMANGGLFSTALDYLQFARMLLNQGELNGQRYLSVNSVQQMSHIQTGELKTGFTPGNGWGIGCCVVKTP